MAKKIKKEENLLVPDIKGLELDIAGDILDDYGIKYKIQDKKIITLFCDKNCVGKTIPKHNKPIKKNEVLEIYPCKFKIGPAIIIFIILSVLLFAYINKHTITPLLFGEPTINQTSSTWDKSKIVYVTDDADFNYSTVNHYKYCISKNKSTSNCDWKDTYTKSIRVSQSGIWYVWFKGISEDYNESYQSNRLKVQIDNEAPVITSLEKTITKRSIEIRVSGKDSLSGISKYYYSINNQEFIEGNKSYTFTSLDENTFYNIKVRVVDKAGNMVDAEISLKTLGDTKTNDTNKAIPQISLINVPSYITYKDEYSLPTSVNNNYSGYTTCYNDEDRINNTSELEIGKHKIVCTTTIDNISVSTYKDIEVVINSGEDEVFDNYVRVNLDYPTTGMKYMYRLATNEVRVDSDGWKYYVKPLYIKKEDINNIIIKYELNGEQIKTRDDLYIDINPDSYIVYDGQETKVSISYKDKQDKIYYSVNGSTYIEYTEPFNVKGESLINSYVIREFKTYNEETNSIENIEIIKTDSVYIQALYPAIGDKENADVSISLSNIPSVIDTKEDYSIPSKYSYGTHGVGILKCYANNKLVNSTSDLESGEYDIVCTIMGADGETRVDNKHITVKDNHYKYDLDNLPGVIKAGYNYELNETCNIKNTKVLKNGFYTIVCDDVTKNIKVVDDDSLYIDITNIPRTITVGELYQLPSHYKGTDIKFIKCLDENNNLIYNTRTLSIGEHKLTCIIDTAGGEQTVSKELIVTKPKYSIDISK